jgi:hypothetical protein
MTNLDRAAFAAFMLGLGEVYGEPVSDARMEIYFSALADLELEEIRQAATAHVKLTKFFPRPSELRDAVFGASEDRADLRWNAMLAVVRRYGFHQTPPDEAWPDEATRRAALDLYGGWRGLCASLPGEGPELLGCAKLFKASYIAYDRRAQRQGLPPGETGRELTRDEAKRALSELKINLKQRGLPTGVL